MKAKIKIPLKLRLFLPVTIIIITVVVIITTWFINRSINTFNAQIRNNLELEVQTISKMFERESMLKLEKVQTNLKVAKIHFYSEPLEITDNMMLAEVEDQISYEKHTASIPVWLHAGKIIYANNDFVDFVSEVVGGSVSVFQKIDSGFVRVATTITRTDGSRAVGTYLSWESPVVESVMNRETYYGRAMVVDEWYTTAYEPIILNDEVVGMLYVGDKEKDMDELKRVLYKLKIGKSGYPFVFDTQGNIIIHPSREGESWKDSTFFHQIQGNNSGVFEYEHDNKRKTVAYRYFEKFELYIAASIVNRIENRELVHSAIIGAATVGLLAILLLMGFIYHFTTDRLYRYFTALQASNRKLATAEEALKQSERLAHMGQISAGIAHELNNPLGVITMYSNIVLDELKEGDSLRQDMELIVEQADRCKGIVSGLLNFARQNKMKTKEVEMDEFVRHSLASVVIPDNIHCRVKTLIQDTSVMIDYDQMLQVTTNLIKNAVDAMPDGGEILICINGNEKEIEVSIKDSGCGIAKENMDKLFTPFFTTKAAGKGTGLGLPLVYGIIKMHKGKIHVFSNTDDNNEQKGTEFIITIPRIH